MSPAPLSRQLIGVTVLSSAIMTSGCLSGSAKPDPKPLPDITPVVTEEQTKQNQAEQHARAAVKSVEEHFTRATTEQLAFFSPANYAKAQEQIIELRALYNKYDPNDTGLFGGPSEEKLERQATKTDQLLSQGFTIKQLVMTHLKQQVDDKSYLDSLEKKGFEKEYRRILKGLDEIIAEVEDDKAFKGLEDDRANLQERMRKFEITLIQTRYLAPLQAALQQTNSRKVPRTYGEAKRQIEALNHQIATNPRDLPAIQQAVEMAEVAVKRAVTVMIEVDKMERAEGAQRETVVLYYHDALNQMAQGLLQRDFAHLPYHENVDQLSTAIQQQQRKKLDQQLESSGSELQSAFQQLKDLAVAESQEKQRQQFESEKQQIMSQHQQERIKQEANQQLAIEQAIREYQQQEQERLRLREQARIEAERSLIQEQARKAAMMEEAKRAARLELQGQPPSTPATALSAPVAEIAVPIPAQETEPTQ